MESSPTLTDLPPQLRVQLLLIANPSPSPSPNPNPSPSPIPNPNPNPNPNQVQLLLAANMSTLAGVPIFKHSSNQVGSARACLPHMR